MITFLYLVALTLFFEYVLTLLNPKKDFVNKRMNISIKRKKILQKKGCLLKSKKFLKSCKQYFCKFDYIFSKTCKSFLMPNILYYGEKFQKKIEMQFAISINEEMQTFSFCDFVKCKNMLCYEFCVSNFNFQLSLDQNFCFRLSCQNKEKNTKRNEFTKSKMCYSKNEKREKLLVR